MGARQNARECLWSCRGTSRSVHLCALVRSFFLLLLRRPWVWTPMLTLRLASLRCPTHAQTIHAQATNGAQSMLQVERRVPLAHQTHHPPRPQADRRCLPDPYNTPALHAHLQPNYTYPMHWRGTVGAQAPERPVREAVQALNFSVPSVGSAVMPDMDTVEVRRRREQVAFMQEQTPALAQARMHAQQQPAVKGGEGGRDCSGGVLAYRHVGPGAEVTGRGVVVDKRIADCPLSGEAGMFEESRWAEKVDEMRQLVQLYSRDFVAADVWRSLAADVDAVRSQVVYSAALAAELDALRAQIAGASQSEAYAQEARAKGAAEGISRIRRELEDGVHADKTAPEYDALILTVQQYQEECAGLREATVVAADGEQRGKELVTALRGFKQSVSEHSLVLSEAAFAARLCSSQFLELPVPNDGDCLFRSIFVAKVALQQLKAARSALALKPGLTGTQLLEKIAGLSHALVASGTLDARIQAMAVIRGDPAAFKPLVVEAFVAATTTNAADATSRLLRTELRDAYQVVLGGQDAPSPADLAHFLGRQSDLLDRYTAVMGNPGVFGEKTELLALSRWLMRPIRLYYYHAERSDSRGQQLPAEEFVGPGASGRDICLLHSVAGRHYSALVRQEWLKQEDKRKPAQHQGPGAVSQESGDGPLAWEYELPDGQAACGLGNPCVRAYARAVACGGRDGCMESWAREGEGDACARDVSKGARVSARERPLHILRHTDNT